jgi:quinol monooxygenase YgiN
VFALVVRFDLVPGQAEAFDALMERTLPAIRSAEPGTLVYVCCRVDSAPDARIFFELYADRAAFEAHERMPVTRRFLSERTSMIATTHVEFLAPYEWKLPIPLG